MNTIIERITEAIKDILIGLIPEFTEYVLEYYEKWQNDELDMDKLKEDLWVYGGVRLEEVEGK